MTCAKKRVICSIMTSHGQQFIGENLCENPQETCPREPGEGYEKCKSICRQGGHAEIAALEKAGAQAKGAVAVLSGHTYACQECQEALFGAGIISLRVMQ
jgi:hypothetical protein